MALATKHTIGHTTANSTHALLIVLYMYCSSSVLLLVLCSTHSGGLVCRSV
jgi:hypothetical protein